MNTKLNFEVSVANDIESVQKGNNKMEEKRVSVLKALDDWYTKNVESRTEIGKTAILPLRCLSR